MSQDGQAHAARPGGASIKTFVYLLAHGLAAEVDQLGGVLLGHASLEGDACNDDVRHR